MNSAIVRRVAAGVFWAMLAAGCSDLGRLNSPPPSSSAAPRPSPTGAAPGASPVGPGASPVGPATGSPAPGASASAPAPGASAAPAEYNFEEADVPVDASKTGPAGAPEQVKRLRGLYISGSGALEKCFAEATKADKLKPAYRLGTLATVKASGEVSVSTSGDAPAPLMSCVQGVMKGWAFPRGEAGYTVKRVLVFKGK